MPLSPRARRRSARGQQIAVMDALESRRLFSETASTIAPFLASVSSPSTDSISLDKYFTNSTTPGTEVTFYTTYGQIKVVLTDGATPLTVANFLSYVQSGAYNDTIFHRSAVLSGSGTPPTTAADIIQGGGYVVQGKDLTHIATNAPVDDEYTTELYNDSAGTLAMAKTSQADSATSEWYFNVHSNVSSLDTPTTDSNGTTTSYTVFGKVLSGMGVIDQIADLPTYQFSSALTTVPVSGIDEGKVKKDYPVTANNLVYVNKIVETKTVSYTVSSDDYSLVAPTINNGVLSFKFASGKYGTATITVIAKNIDGTSAATSFPVTVPNTAATSPTATAVTAPAVTEGTTSTFSVLGSDTDPTSALNPAGVTITTQPTHGTAVVNTSSGLITYTPTAGYTGSDSLSYTVSDLAGTTSSAAAVTLNVVTAPGTVTIGSKTIRSLTFTQPNGIVGHLTIGGATALVTFASSDVTLTTAHGIATASGAGATIASITITNDNAGAASLTLTSTGAVSLGSVTDAGALSTFDAPDATLTGTFSFGSINKIIAAAASDSALLLGSGAAVSVLIPTLTNTGLSNTGSIARISSKNWLTTDGGYYAVAAPKIMQLDVSGTFADQLTLSDTGVSLASAVVGTPTAAWTTAGSADSIVVTSPPSTWSITANTSISTLTVQGNLSSSNISAPSISSVLVIGSATGAHISSTQSAISSLKFKGALNSTTISSNAGIESLSAASMSANTITSTTLGNLTVTGATFNGSIQCSAAAVRGVAQVGKLRFGAISGTTIGATGNVGDVTAASTVSLTLSADNIDSLIVAGTAATDNISTTTGTSTIGKLRFGGALSASTISTAGDLTSIYANEMATNTVTAAGIGSVVVAGTTAGTTFTTTSSTEKIAVMRLGGAVTGSTVAAAGNIGTVTAASLSDSNIYAGVTTAMASAGVLPTGTSDFASDTKIASVTLGKAATVFSDSIISADVIGDLHLGNVDTTNTTAFGVATHSLHAITADLGTGGIINAGPKDLKSATTLAAYEKAKKITLGEFEVSLF